MKIPTILLSRMIFQSPYCYIVFHCEIVIALYMSTAKLFNIYFYSGLHVYRQTRPISAFRSTRYKTSLLPSTRSIVANWLQEALPARSTNSLLFIIPNRPTCKLPQVVSYKALGNSMGLFLEQHSSLSSVHLHVLVY